jgi:beta-mannosidase
LQAEQEIGRGTVLFVPANEFAFELPELELEAQEDEACFRINVRSSCFAKGIMLDTDPGDCVFSDNWFDLSPGDEKQVLVRKEDARGITSLKMFQDSLFTNSLNHIMLSE